MPKQSAFMSHSAVLRRISAAEAAASVHYYAATAFDAATSGFYRCGYSYAATAAAATRTLLLLLLTLPLAALQDSA